MINFRAEFPRSARVSECRNQTVLIHKPGPKELLYKVEKKRQPTRWGFEVQLINLGISMVVGLLPSRPRLKGWFDHSRLRLPITFAKGAIVGVDR